MDNKNIDGQMYEINSHWKLFHWMFFEKILLANWGYQFDWESIIAEGYNKVTTNIYPKNISF